MISCDSAPALLEARDHQRTHQVIAPVVSVLSESLSDESSASFRHKDPSIDQVAYLVGLREAFNSELRRRHRQRPTEESKKET